MSAFSLTSPRHFGGDPDGGESLISTVSAVFAKQAHQARTAPVEISIQMNRHPRAIAKLAFHVMPGRK